MAKVRRTTDGRWIFECPACEECHGPNDTWQFNGDLDKPTFSPSLLVRGFEWLTDEQQKRIEAGEHFEPIPKVCHSFIRDGKIEFLSDCTHSMAGQTVEIPDWDDSTKLWQRIR